MSQNEAGSIEQSAAGGQPAVTRPAKRRPLKQSLGAVPRSGTEKKREIGVWVLLDVDGNTQEVTHRDVNILLDGASADSVLAESVAHTISQCCADRSTRSETGTNLESIVQESLLLLRREESIGEQCTQRKLNFGRKTGNMLLYISQPQITENDKFESEPSVRFINVDTERVQLWRHSHDFNRVEVNFDASTTKERPLIAQETFLRETFPDAASSTNNHAVDPCEHRQISKPDKSRSILYRFMQPQNTKNVQSNALSMPEYFASQTRLQNKAEDDSDRHKELLHEERYRPSLLHLEPRKPSEKQERLMNSEHEETFVREWNKSEHHLASEPAMECISSHGRAQTFRELKRDIQDLKMHMFESECTIKQSIAKYISDKELEKQLLKAVESYSRKKLESEHKIKTLAQDIIEDQLDVLKNQQQVSEVNINSLQKRNRYLEEENITLLKKMERLELRLSKQQSVEVDVNNTRPLTKEESSFIQNNKKLRAKLSFTQSQVEAMEGKLQEAQCRADNFAAQVRCLKSEMENQKLYRGRMETDHEIECTSFKEELSAKSRLLRESMEAANILVDDMNLLKQQLKKSANNIQINWNSLLLQPIRNNSLTDLVHMCRGCISELGKELITTQNHLQLTNRDLNSIRAEAAHIRQVLDETIEANNILKAELEKSAADKDASEKLIHHLSEERARLQEHLSISVHDRMDLEDELGKLKRHNETEKRRDVLGEKVGKAIQETLASNVKEELDASIKTLSEENQKLLQNLNDAETNFKQLQLKVDSDEEGKKNQDAILKELQNSNIALKKEIDLLHQTNIPSMADVNIADKLMKVDKELYKEIAEKVYLVEELQAIKTDHAALIESQQSYITHIQLTQNDLDLLMQENASLKAEHENAQRIITCLEYDNYNIMGQRNANHTNTENQIKVMRAALVEKRDVGKEFARIIDQNNKTMIKLESSLVEKDAMVSQLEHQVAQLHTSSQLEIKDWQCNEEQLKANLESIRRDSQQACDSMKHELMTAKNELEVLKMKLTEKNGQLDHYKKLVKEFDSYCATDIDQREEITNLKEKLLEHEITTKQRDKLIESQQDFLSEIEELHDKLRKRDNNISSLTKECKTQAVQIAELQEKLKHSIANFDQTVEGAKSSLRGMEGLKMELKEATDKLLEYEQHIAKMDRGIQEHVSKMERELDHESNEKCKLHETVDHLKSVIDAQQGSLDEALKQISSMRKMEKDLKNMLEEERKQQMKTEDAFKKQNDVLQKAEHLSGQLNHAKAKYATLSDEYCRYQDTMDQNARVKELEQQMVTLHAEKKDLLMELNIARQSRMSMQECNKFAEKSTSSHGETRDSLDIEKRKIEEFKQRMVILDNEATTINEIQQLRETEHSVMALDLQHAKKQLLVISQQLEQSIASLEEERCNNKLFITQMKSEHSAQKKHLLKEIKEMGLNKQYVDQLVSEKENAIAQLEKEHEDMSEKLLRAIRMVIDEKTLRQKLESTSQEFAPVLEQLKTEKANHSAKIQELEVEVNQLKQNIANTATCKSMQSKSQVEYELKDFHGNVPLDSSRNCSSRAQIKDTNFKYEKAELEEDIAVKRDTIKQYETQSTLLERVKRLTKALNDTRNKLLCQRQDVGKLEKKIITLQAEKRKLGLRLRELNGLELVESQLRCQLQHCSDRCLEQLTDTSCNSGTYRNTQKQQLRINTSHTTEE